jgi:hypothetical protein
MKETVSGPDAHLVWEHIQRARERFRGERQLEQYVAGLSPEECARILAASPRGLPALARNHDRCRVEADEARGFVEVLRTWTLYVLSGLEGG